MAVAGRTLAVAGRTAVVAAIQVVRVVATVVAGAVATAVVAAVAVVMAVVNNESASFMNFFSLKRMVISIVLILFAVGAAAVWWYWHRPSSSPYAAGSTASQVLATHNKDFVRAQDYAAAGDYQSAEKAYQSALLSASDGIQKGQIEYNLAILRALEGHSIEAIQQFKNVAANAAAGQTLRAYAVQRMGTLYYNSLDPAITKEIFKDAPYASMRVSTSTSLSYRHLFEYSSFFYPLAISELSIADWYARQLAVSSTTSQAGEYTGIIRQKFKNADTDIARIGSDPYARDLVPIALTAEARTTGRLAIAGLTSPRDADAAYQKAISAFSTYRPSPGSDAYARVAYASFLQRMYGSSRLADIHTTLAPLSAGSYAKTPIMTYLGNARTFPGSTKTSVVKLAAADDIFKRLLVSLGWQSSDFK